MMTHPHYHAAIRTPLKKNNIENFDKCSKIGTRMFIVASLVTIQNFFKKGIQNDDIYMNRMLLALQTHLEYI